MGSWSTWKKCRKPTTVLCEVRQLLNMRLSMNWVMLTADSSAASTAVCLQWLSLPNVRTKATASRYLQVSAGTVNKALYVFMFCNCSILLRPCAFHPITVLSKGPVSVTALGVTSHSCSSITFFTFPSIILNSHLDTLTLLHLCHCLSFLPFLPSLSLYPSWPLKGPTRTLCHLVINVAVSVSELRARFMWAYLLQWHQSPLLCTSVLSFFFSSSRLLVQSALYKAERTSGTNIYQSAKLVLFLAHPVCQLSFL